VNPSERYFLLGDSSGHGIAKYRKHTVDGGDEPIDRVCGKNGRILQSYKDMRGSGGSIGAACISTLE
jgi:hypothetical protein